MMIPMKYYVCLEYNISIRVLFGNNIKYFRGITFKVRIFKACGWNGLYV